jgi:hypothetical protein
MKRFRSYSKRKKTALLSVLALVIVGVAFGAWLIATIGGSAKARAAQLTAPTVTAPASVASGNLFPSPLGTFGGSLWVSVTNPNSVPLTIDSFGISGGGALTSDSASCPIANVQGRFEQVSDGDGDGLSTHGGPVDGATGINAVPSVVPGGGATTLVELKNTVSLVPAAPTACQGVTFTLNAPSINMWFKTS